MLSTFDRRIAAQLGEANLPGLVVRVVRDGEPIYSAGFGVRRLPDGPAPDAETLFAVSSFTKMITAILVLRLKESSRLALDDPITDYLGELRGTRLFHEVPPPTIRQLLCHMGGVPMGPHHLRRLDPGRLAQQLEGMRPAYPPGETFKYSNLGYMLLGHLVAEGNGRPYDDCLRSQLAPVLASGRFASAVELDQQVPVAVGYQRDHHRSLVRRDDRLSEAPRLGGALGASHLYADAIAVTYLLDKVLIGGPSGHGVISEDSYREMTTSHTPSGKINGLGYGLGVHVADCLGHRCLQHAGGGPGFTSLSAALPGPRLSLVLLTNRCSAHPELHRIFRRIVETFVGPASPDRAPEPPRRAPYAGTYRSAAACLAIRRAGGRWLANYDGVAVPISDRGHDAFVQHGGPYSEYLLRFEVAGRRARGCSAGPAWFARGRRPRDDVAPDKPAFTALEGAYQAPDYGQAQVYQRNGNLIFAICPLVEVQLRLAGPERSFIQLNGPFGGEPLDFAPEGPDRAPFLVAGTMRFDRVEPAVPGIGQRAAPEQG